jgi:hypothetical protein
VPREGPDWMRVANLKSRQRGVEAGRAQSCISIIIILLAGFSLIENHAAFTTLCESIAKIKIKRASPRRRLFLQ